MSNKANANTAKPKAKRIAKPKLRFPEFHDAKPWEETRLRQLGKLVSGLTYKPDDVQEDGLLVLRSSNIQNGKILLDDCVYVTPEIKGGNLSKPNDILICVRNGSRALIGKNALIPDGLPLSTHGAFMTVLRAKSPSFVFQLFQTDAYNRQVAADLGATINSINGRQLIKYKFFVPSPAEQKKIADCLASLDGLIEVQGKKLEALQAYKKGLLQQLFPAEGETVPKLRFPEFRETAVWQRSVIGPMTVKIGSGITPRGGEKTYKNEGRPFIRSQNVGWGKLILEDVAFIDDATHATFSATEIVAGDVLLNITGASIGRSVVATSKIEGGNVNQHVCIIRPKSKKLSSEFLNQFLLSHEGQKQIDSFQTGGNRQGLNFGQIRSFTIPLPPSVNEQIKIGEFLFSIEGQLTIQRQKIDALQAHKKGLMQQIFPAPDEVQS